MEKHARFRQSFVKPPQDLDFRHISPEDQGMRFVERVLQSMIRRSHASAKSTLVVTGVLVAGLGFFATRMPEAISIQDQLDPAGAEAQRLTSYREEFRDHGILGFLVETKGRELEALEKFESALSLYVLDVPIVRSHMSPLKIQKVTHDGERFSIEPDRDLSAKERTFFEGGDGTSWLYLFQLQDPLAPMKVTDWLPKFESDVEALLPGAKFDWFGAPFQELHMHRGAKKIQIINVLIVLAVLVAFRFYFGTWKSGIVFWSTMIVTFAVVYGGFALSGGKQDLVFLTIFMIMTVAAIEDFIFVALERQGERATIENFTSNALPSFLTSLTTFIGFVSLSTSDLHSIRLFGLWAGIGAMTEWLVVFTVLPAMIRLWPSSGDWVRNGSFARSRPSKKLLSFRLSPILGIATFAIFLLPLGFNERFQLTQSPAKTFPSDHVVTEAYERLTASRGWIGNVELVFENGVSREKKREVIATIEREPEVVHVDDSATVVDAMSSSITDPDMKRTVSELFQTLPAGRRYFGQSGSERAWIFLDTLDIGKILRIEEKTRQLCPDGSCSLQGDFLAFSRYSRNLIDTLFSSFLASITLVGLILAACAYASGMMRLLPAILLSSFWAPFAALFTIWVYRIEVNFVTSIVLSVLVGLTGDNAIHYIFANRDLDKGAQEKGRATLICSLSMIGVSLLFVLAPFEPTKLLGLLLAQGFLLVFVGDYALLRGLLKKRVRGARPKEAA